jgi:hypothetical protein
VDLDEILYGGDDVEDDLDVIFFNPVPSTVSKWRTFNPLSWVHIFSRLVDLDEI